MPLTLETLSGNPVAMAAGLKTLDTGRQIKTFRNPTVRNKKLVYLLPFTTHRSPIKFFILDARWDSFP